ncbi:phosphatase PAP2 family protein [Pontibacter arcticus]|uniref:PAP2 family protein n=1 Tax=Pontibacter arcticus TaxID=2080288 RepID=A0A364RB83_9BACT|nr:phosphatase PAP2 family protein [Pontibacter arcticus]RAU81562.1 PAP2 family protein [Pontibacter arcticus]
MKDFLSHRIRSFLAWLVRQPLVARFRKQFPGLAGFILNRFDTSNFLGLPLTLLLLAGLVNMALLTELTEDMLETEGIVAFDEQVTAGFFAARTSILSQFLYFISYFGTREATFILGGLATVFFLYKRRFVAIVAFWLVMAGVGLSVQYGKTYIQRDRPADVAYYQEHNYSFPSGHATTSMALYGMLAYFLMRRLKKGVQRRLVLAAAVILILLVGLSRIYLGVHFLSDVLAGYLLGILWLMVGISLVEVMLHRRNRRLLTGA